MTNHRIALCILLPVLASSCATVTRGPNEKFTVESTPSDAAVELSTGQKGTTPATFKISRRKDIKVTVEKSGYNKQEIEIPSKFTGGGGLALAGNVLIGGVIGAGIDAATGSIYGHKPNPLHVTLEKK